MQSTPLFPGVALENRQWWEVKYVCPETFREVPERGLPAAESVIRALPAGRGRAAFLLLKNDRGLVLALYEYSGDGFRVAAQLQIADPKAWGYQIGDAWLHFNGEHLVCRMWTPRSSDKYMRTMVFDLTLRAVRDAWQACDSSAYSNMPAGGGKVVQEDDTMAMDAFGQKTRIAVPANVFVGPVRLTTRFVVADDVQDTRLVFRGATGSDHLVTDGSLILDVWSDAVTQAGGHVGQVGTATKWTREDSVCANLVTAS